MDKQDLRGMVAIITGGSTEVAGAVALALAREGVQVCLCGRQADLLDLAANRIKAIGGTCLTSVSELDSLEEAESVMEYARTAFGRLNILILISPFWAGGQIHNHSIKTWDLVLTANLREPFLMARTVLPVFREQKHGEIMAIGSDSSMGIYPQDGAYSVAMHALTTLMELIRAENMEFGIRTHILSPGVALTNDTDLESRPALTVSHVAEWVVWLLARPAHLRGNGPILV
ncbi:MAG TPA: SDR family oxidoreductase [Anaerolineales bacterium]|nr:SDR family oxidoreductase [Anaerolineales bacterium]